MDPTTDDAKSAARALRRALADDDFDIGHSRALEIVARQLGYPDWNTAAAGLMSSALECGPAVPVLRTQSEAIAREFYVDYLRFRVEWVHRFEPGLPAYLRLRRGRGILDLSEHHGDGTPGTVVWIPVVSAAALCAELSERPHPRLRPSIDDAAPGGPTVEVTDPFGNVLRFCERAT